MDKADAPLSDLLDDVHRALRTGDFAALPGLTAAMEAAEAAPRPITAEELKQIRRLAERNARSLIAARRGIKAARRRIAEVISAARGLVTYDRQGQRVEETDQRILAKRF